MRRFPMFVVARRSSSVELWRGPSEFDGKPIVVIATNIIRRSRNGKTKAMIQVWILRQDISPIDAVLRSEDYSICGWCPFRARQGCYVNTAKAVLNVWRSWRRGAIPRVGVGVGSNAAEYLIGNSTFPIRWGAYGDMGAVPQVIGAPMMSTVRNARNGYTAYTHAWLVQSTQWLAGFAMASVSTKTEHDTAVAMGWKTFAAVERTKDIKKIAVREGLLPCPALKGAACDTCKLCAGQGSALRTTTGVIIPVHGSASLRAEAQIRAMRTALRGVHTSDGGEQ